MTADRQPCAAVVTVGSEIVDGIGLDTNTREIASALTAAGYRVSEAVSVPDDPQLVAAALERLTAHNELVICTGGLGPTHDDITREAAAQALGRALVESTELRAGLESVTARHAQSGARKQVFRQALVLDGALVIPPTSGTAPGQIVPSPAGRLVLLPGPPHEMRPMLEHALDLAPRQPVRILGCVGSSESDAQLTAQSVLGDAEDVDLTVLATPGHVRVVLVGRGAEPSRLDLLAEKIASSLGDRCYATDGTGLAETVLRHARERGVTIACAESCTGGLVAAALTAVPGSSASFEGAVVAYSNASKKALLDVPPGMLAQYGAVSEEVAREMALGARARFGVDLAVSVTGIAGPDGGSADKPVGLVWFGVADASGALAVRRDLFGDRDGIRERATVVALDLLRRRLTGMEIG